MKPEGLIRMQSNIDITISRFVRNCADKDPFLRNFRHTLKTPEKRLHTIAEGIIADTFRPDSNVSYILIAGIPGSGKTTLANAVTNVIENASLGLWVVERRSFTDYRRKAAGLLQQAGQWTKAEETRLATEMMREYALQIMQEGPFDKKGVRRIVIAEMPVYSVDGKERGMRVLQAISEREQDVPYDKRRARVNFVRPDFDVVTNAVLTRMMGMSSGGSPEIIAEIAHKAFAGAMLFGELQPNLYKQLFSILRKPSGLHIYRKDRLAIRAGNIIALRMIAILLEHGLFGRYDTVLMNQSRRSLIHISRHFPQQQLAD